MNIAFNLNQFRSDHIFFMDTKPNSLIDGLFTKLNYCDEQFSMNGLYLTFPGEAHDGAAPAHKVRIESSYYRALCEIEQELLRMRGAKTIQCKLGEALHAKYEIVGTKLTGPQTPIVVKISGVWENKQGHVGLSYRIL
jgi:hypothetical protein